MTDDVELPPPAPHDYALVTITAREWAEFKALRKEVEQLRNSNEDLEEALRYAWRCAEEEDDNEA